MSCGGGLLFLGFELENDYVENLMSDFPKNKWGNHIWYKFDVVERLEKLLGKGLELSCHGFEDVITYFVAVESYYVEAGDSELVRLRDLTEKEKDTLTKSAEKLKIELKPNSIGWHLAASLG